MSTEAGKQACKEGCGCAPKEVDPLAGFFDNQKLLDEFVPSEGGAMDAFLQNASVPGSDGRIQEQGFESDFFTSVRSLVQRKAFVEGDNVVFKASLESVFHYDNPPIQISGDEYTPLRGRVAAMVGDTAQVVWEDGVCRNVYAYHLELQPVTMPSQIKVASDDVDLIGRLFEKSATQTSALVHKSTRDLWSFQQTKDGGFQITRLFDDTGEPLKEC